MATTGSGGSGSTKTVDATTDVPSGHYFRDADTATAFDIFTEGDVVKVVTAGSNHENDGIWTVTEIIKDTDNAEAYLEVTGRTMIAVSSAESHTISSIPANGDRKVALCVPTTDASVGVGTVAIWSHNQRASSVSGWKSDEITIAREETGAKALYTYVDEVLRVSDRSFTNNSMPKWYGYIQRIQFKTAATTAAPEHAGASLTGWFECPTYLYPPTYIEVADSQNVSYAGLTQQVAGGSSSAARILNLAAITTATTEFTVMDSAGTAATNNTMEGFFHAGKVYSFSETTNANAYLEFMLIRDVPTMESTTSKLKVYRAYGTNPVAVVADGSSGPPYGEAYDDIYERGRGWGVSLHDTTDAGGLWQAGNYEIWGSFIYDDLQESKPIKGDAVFNIAADGSKIRVIISADKVYAPRITGGRLYIRREDSNDPLTLLTDIDIVKGVRTTFDQNYKQWAWDDTNKAYAVEQNVVTNGGGALGDTEPIYSFGPNLDTYASINGYDYQMDRVSIGKRNEGWKAATVANRRMFVGNLRLLDKSNAMNKHGERLMYSELGRYDTFPSINYIDVSLGDFGEYVALESFADRLFGFKDSLVHIINIASPSPSDWYLEDTLHMIGIRYPYSVCKTPFGIVWVNSKGCWIHNGSNVVNLIENKIARTEDINGLLDPWATFAKGSAKYVDPMVGYDPNAKHLVIFRSPTDASTNSNNAFIYDFDSANWTFTGGSSSAQPEITSVECVADSSDSLNGKYFDIYGAGGKTEVWIDTDDSGTSAPSGSGSYDQTIEVTEVETDDDANSVAIAVAAAVDDHANFICEVQGSVVKISDAANNTRTNASDGDTGFTITTLQEGAGSAVSAGIFEDSETYTNFVNDWDGNLVIGSDNDSNGVIFKSYNPARVAQGNQIWTSKVFDFGNPGTTKKIYAVYVTYKLTAQQEGALKYSIGSSSTYPLTTFTAFGNCSVNGTVGDGSGNDDIWVVSANSGTSWEVAKFSNDTPISCDSIALRFESSASCSIAISDITIEYRNIHKRIS